jgi:hypothetical protein
LSGYFRHLLITLEKEFPTMLSFSICGVTNEVNVIRFENATVACTDFEKMSLILSKSKIEFTLDYKGLLHNVSKPYFSAKTHLSSFVNELQDVMTYFTSASLIFQRSRELKARYLWRREFLTTYAYLLVVWKTKLPFDLRKLLWNLIK